MSWRVTVPGRVSSHQQPTRCPRAQAEQRLTRRSRSLALYTWYIINLMVAHCCGRCGHRLKDYLKRLRDAKARHKFVDEWVHFCCCCLPSPLYLHLFAVRTIRTSFHSIRALCRERNPRHSSCLMVFTQFRLKHWTQVYMQ